jgi:ankyrin repeat protein
MLQAACTMPSNPGSIYAQTLEQINSQSASQSRLARKVLCWLVLAKRNLFVSELVAALSTEPGVLEPDRLNKRSASVLIKVCRGLVILDNDTGIIRLAHLTVYDFLAISLTELSQMRTEAGLICLTYVSLNSFKEGPCVALESLLDRWEQYPFYLYCASYLVEHLRDMYDDSSLFNLLMTFSYTRPIFESYLQAVQHMEFSSWTDGYNYYARDSTTVHIAAILGNTELLLKLLGTCADDIDSENSHGMTPLILAIVHDHESLVRLLLKYGATTSTKFGETALNCAARERRDGIVRLLLQEEQNDHAYQLQSKVHDLIVTAITGDEASVDSLLADGVPPDERDPEGGTALQWAAWYGHKPVVARLLQSGANVEAEDQRGRRAMHEASERGHVGICQLLLNRGAELDPKDGFGLTPFHRAAYVGGMETTLLLLDAGADINTVDSIGDSALTLAIRSGNIEMVQLLLTEGATVKDLEMHKLVFEPNVTDSQYGTIWQLVTKAKTGLTKIETEFEADQDHIPIEGLRVS